MPIQIRGAATCTTIPSTSPRTTAKPTGLATGDLILLCVGLASSIPSANITPPAGFTLVASSSIVNTPSIHL